MDHDHSQLAPYRHLLPEEVLEQYGLGLISTDDFLSAIRPLLPEKTDTELIALWNSLHGGIPDERLDLLERIHEHIPCFILSNNNDLHWRDVEDRYPRLLTLVDGLILSHRIHLRKPDDSIYDFADDFVKRWHTEHSLTYQPTEVLFVDDLAANTEAAARHGWQTCNSWHDFCTAIDSQALLKVNKC